MQSSVKLLPQLSNNTSLRNYGGKKFRLLEAT